MYNHSEVMRKWFIIQYFLRRKDANHTSLSRKSSFLISLNNHALDLASDHSHYHLLAYRNFQLPLVSSLGLHHHRNLELIIYRKHRRISRTPSLATKILEKKLEETKINQKWSLEKDILHAQALFLQVS